MSAIAGESTKSRRFAANDKIVRTAPDGASARYLRHHAVCRKQARL